MTWQQRFAGLLAGTHTSSTDPLDAGAQLVVADPDGDEVFRSALARHHRIDDHDPRLVWIRPVCPGAVDPETGQYVFNLSLSRRRALNWTGVDSVEGGGLLFTLANGQKARVEPARGVELDELRRWDDFTLLTLTAAEEHDLEALEEDSWTGRFA